MGQATDRILGGRYGRQRYQNLFRWFHRTALAGLNYGNANPTLNGENALLDRLASEWPSSPVVFDVGAFHGDWTGAVLERSPSARVYAFEPMTASFAALEAKFGHRASLQRCALGSSQGSADIWAPAAAPDWASLHERDLKRFGQVAESVERVPVQTLDGFCTSEGLDRIDLLKVDAEGNELAVLEGAESLLARGAIDAIQFEFGGASLDARVFLRDIVGKLTPGYGVFRVLIDGLVPVRDDELEEIFTYANYVALRE